MGDRAPELRSRLRSAAMVNHRGADEALLGAVLVKTIPIAKLSSNQDVIGYVMRRMERSMAAAQSLVEALDRTALAEKTGGNAVLEAKLFSAESPVSGLSIGRQHGVMSCNASSRLEGLWHMRRIGALLP